MISRVQITQKMFERRTEKKNFYWVNQFDKFSFPTN